MSIFLLVRKLMYKTLGKFDEVVGNKPKVFILCYHSISDDSWRFSINYDVFKKQINYLLKNYHPISLADLNLFIHGKKKLRNGSFVITFDDGYKDIFKVKNLLKNSGVKPTVFILSSPNKANRSELGSNKRFLNVKEINYLRKDGWEIGCHSATHPDFSKLTELGIKQEVIESKKSMNYFAFPKGRYTDKVINSLKISGYKLGLTMNDSLIKSGSDPYILPRVGIDRSHSLEEFKYTFLPSVILIRSLFKRLGLGVNV